MIITRKCDCIKLKIKPQCGVAKVKKYKTFDDILSNNFLFENSFICPNNSLSIDNVNSIIILTEKCIKCNLCYNSCKFITEKKEINFQNNVICESFFYNVDFATLLLNELDLNFEFYSNIQVQGFSRNKRIEILGKNESKYFLIKLITNKNSYSKYLRSYEEIREYLNLKYPDKNFKIVFIMKEFSNEDAIVLNYNNILKLKNY